MQRFCRPMSSDEEDDENNEEDDYVEILTKPA